MVMRKEIYWNSRNLCKIATEHGKIGKSKLLWRQDNEKSAMFLIYLRALNSAIFSVLVRRYEEHCVFFSFTMRT